MFEHGALRFVLLKLIGDQPSHGYELIKAVEDKLAGRYSPSPGVVYPTLTLLEELDYVTVAPSDGARKLYTITDAGRSFLAENQETVDAIFARMAARREDASEAEQPDRAPQIIRAVENLRLALCLRLARKPLSEETINAIAGTLDSAAQSLERL
jgi:DNA-binding PadR family transcriptional regulator